MTVARQTIYKTPHEKMLERWYRDGGDAAMRYSYPLERSSVVMDLGGHQGDWAAEIFARYACDVHVFEPVASFADAIRRRFDRNPSIHVHAFGLGAGTRDEQIYLHGDGSSTYRRGMEAETMRVVDACAWLDEQHIESVALMKVNIEGGEYELLPRLVGSGAIERIAFLQVQFHDIAPDSARQMTELTRQLERTHELTYRYDFVWDSWRRKGRVPGIG